MLTIGEAIQNASTVAEIRAAGYAVMRAVNDPRFGAKDLESLPLMIPANANELLRSTYKARLVMWRFGLSPALKTHLNQLPL